MLEITQSISVFLWQVICFWVVWKFLDHFLHLYKSRKSELIKDDDLISEDEIRTLPFDQNVEMIPIECYKKGS